MKYRRLGKTGLTVSVVGVGTWQYGGEWGQAFDQPTVDAIFDAARGRGVNLVDTAECYGDHAAEAFVGHAVRRDRDRWVVATKFGHVFHGPFDRTDERSAKDVRPQVEASLRALQTDRIDVLQFHSVRDAEFTDEAVRDELQKLVRDGKVRFVGNSIGNAGPTVDGRNAQAARSTEFHADVLQVIYNRLDRKPEDGTPSLFDMAIQQDLGILARVPLASGFLSGKYKPGDTFHVGDVRQRQDPATVAEKLGQAQQIQRDEVPANVDMATWALAWCLRHQAVTAVIPGCKSAAQLETNADASDLVAGDHPQAEKAIDD